jgi:hypothetical protein
LLSVARNDVELGSSFFEMDDRRGVFATFGILETLSASGQISSISEGGGPGGTFVGADSFVTIGAIAR